MLGLVMVGTFMTTLDTSIVNISLPAVARAFGTPLSGPIEWVLIVYLVVIAGLLLTFGRLSDVIGRKPVWVSGLFVFTIGSALCGIAPNLPALVAARAFQGIGGALIFAPSVALITDAFGPEHRGRAIGLNAVAVSFGVAAGPSFGGIITEHLTWRWIFFINVPVGMVAALAAMRLLERGRGRPRGFDVGGAVLLGLGLALLTLGLSFGQEWGWTSPALLGCVLVAACSLSALVVVERRVREPNLDLNLLTCRPFAAALISLILSFLGLFAVGFLMPFYFENLRGFSPQTSGFLLTPFALAVAASAPVSGSLADRIGSRWIASAGMAVACVGLFLLSFLDAGSSYFDIIWRLLVVGIGTGVFQTPNNRALMQAAPSSEQGEASGMLGTGRVVGQSLSVAVAGAVFAALGGLEANQILQQSMQQAQSIAPDQLMSLQHHFLSGFHAALLTSAAVTAIGIIMSYERR
jgi:EmrB/QacA subfamily drug resistance transporter